MTTTNSWNSGIPVVVPNGGTGVIAFGSAFGVLTAGMATTAVVNTVTPGTSGFALVSQGSASFPLYAQIPGQNMVVNGDFQVWQRGAGGSASFALAANTTTYTADRWQVFVATGQASVVSQVAGATSGSYLLKYLRNTGQTGTGVVRVGTSLTRDMCIGAAGGLLSLSYKAKAGANFSAGTLQCIVYSGTGTTDVSGLTGGWTGVNAEFSTSTAITTTLTQVTASSTASVGSSVTELAVVFYIIPSGTAGADDSFYITDVQLEISPVPTPFQRRNFGDELRTCKRFYQKTFDYAVAPAQNVASNVGAIGAVGSVASTAFGANWILDGLMRTNAPTITTFSPNAATANWSTNTTTPTAVVSQVGGSNVFLTGTTAVTAGNSYYLHVTAENDVT